MPMNYAKMFKKIAGDHESGDKARGDVGRKPLTFTEKERSVARKFSGGNKRKEEKIKSAIAYGKWKRSR